MNIKAARTKVLLNLIFALSAGNAYALGLGEIDLRSYLGQPLDARIPVSAGVDEPLDNSCFKLINGAVTSDTGHATPAKLSFQQIGRNNILQIRSASSVPEPAVRIQIEVSCGNVSRISREYTLLLDPPEYAASRINLPAKPLAPTQQVTSVAQPEQIVQQVPTSSNAPISGDVSYAPSSNTSTSAPLITNGIPRATAPRKAPRPRVENPAPVAKAPTRIAPLATAPVPRPAYKPAPDLAPPVEKIVFAKFSNFFLKKIT